MAILLVAAVAMIPISAQTAAARAPVRAEALVDQLRSGQAIYLEGVDVIGDVDLRSLVEVKPPLHCRSCHLRGALRGQDVVFDKTLDLSGSQIDGPVDMTGAMFESAVTFERVGAYMSQFGEGASFDGSTFVDIASFSGTLFEGDADFSAAKFRSDARFDNAEFRGRAGFEGTVFDGPATFSSYGSIDAPGDQPAPPAPQGPCASVQHRGAFSAAALFSRARARSVIDFRLRCFGGPAFFDEMDLRDSLDMTLARFFDKAVFDKSRIGGGAFFRAVRFEGGASFDSATASGDLDFAGAMFPDGADAVFFRLTSTGALLLHEASFASKSRVDLDKLSVHHLSMDLESVQAAGNPVQQQHLLQTIEEGSRSEGDLDIANKARYRRQVLEAAELGSFRRMLDAVFYRTICGYFVRPLQPLATLAAIILFVALIRKEGIPEHASTFGATSAVDRHPRSISRSPKERRRPNWLARYLHKVERTVGIAVSKSPPREEQMSSVTIAGWLEYVTYKLLVIAILLGLANSNETLRQMLNAIK